MKLRPRELLSVNLESWALAKKGGTAEFIFVPLWL